MDFENDHPCGSSRNNFLLLHEGRMQQGMNQQKKMGERFSSKKHHIQASNAFDLGAIYD